MVGTVTLGIDRYNALYKRALQADTLEKENAELRERLNGTTDVSYEVVDGSELRNDTNKVTLDATEVYRVIRQAFDKVKEEENVKSVKDLLAEHEMLRNMGVFKHYAKGGIATKGETW